jgi:periplasmic divalent cation tolerance protein
MTDIWLVYSTFPNRAEALSVARQLVEKHVVACANIVDGITSVYRWQSDIQQESEVVMIAKTSAHSLNTALELIKSLHSYDVPCITAWPIEAGHLPFLRWVEDETGGRA